MPRLLIPVNKKVSATSTAKFNFCQKFTLKNHSFNFYTKN